MKNTFIPTKCWAGTMLLAAGIIFYGGVALAAPRYEKKSSVEVQAKQTEATKLPEKGKAQAPTRPGIMAEQFRQETAAKVERLTDQAINHLIRLIQATDDNDPEKPDFFFRLAEHYRDKKVQSMFKARELDEKIYNARGDSEKGRFKSLQKSYEKQEKKWMLEAIKKYLEIAQKPAYSKFKRMDEVLFNVADMLNQANRRDKARVFFSQLIKNYPQSKYIPDAYLSFAEFYFNEGKVEEALKLYQQVGRYPNSPVFGYAVYKQGWCWLNLQDPRQALEMFVRVINNSQKWAGTKKSKLILIKEAKKDAVRAYSHVGNPEQAWTFFQRIGGKYAMRMLEMLANLYYDQGKFLESVQIYHRLMALNPTSKDLCNWQYAIVKATLSGKDKKNQVEESQRLAKVYLESKKLGKMKKSALDECRSNASAVLRELATTWHREAQKTQNEDTYALAQHLYKEYLDTFPKEKDTYLMSYYYAELLYKLERWQPAAEAYTKVVKMNPKGKHLKEAAYAAVIAWKNALNVEEEAKDVDTKTEDKKGKGRGRAKKEETKEQYKPQAIPDRQQKMIEAFDTYIKFVPNSDELVPIMYRKARIYYNYNHFDRAADMFATIVSKHPDHELAEYAANLLLDCLNIQEKYEELNKWVRKMMKEPKIAKGEFLGKLKELDTAAKRKHVEQLQKIGRYKECGDRYADMANESPDDPKWPELVYNGAICYEAAKLIGMAISLRNSLIKVKPDDKLSQKALFMIGANYHALAWYSRAADYYERFATKYPGEKESPEAMQNAIVFRLGRGETDKAIDDAQFFSKTFGGRKKFASKAASVNFSLAAIYEQRHNREAIIKHYTTYLKKWGRQGGIDRQIQAHYKIGLNLWEESCPNRETVNGACIKMYRVEAKRKIKAKKRRGKKKRGIEMKTQCGPETKMKVTVTTRNPAKARSAQNHFKQALALYKQAKGGKAVRGEDEEERMRRATDMNFAAAASLFYQTEQQFEDFLSEKFPTGLDFSDRNKKKKEKSLKEFGKYLNTKAKKLDKTSNQYQEVMKLRVAHWAIAASARIGQLYQNFSDALYTASIPKVIIPSSLTSKDAQEEFVTMFTDAYCDQLEDKAGPLEKKAVQGLGTCLSKSTELSWYNEWSQLCEAELNQIMPAEYPLAAEIRAEPGYVTYHADRADVMTELK